MYIVTLRATIQKLTQKNLVKISTEELKCHTKTYLTRKKTVTENQLIL